jgi:conjugal transfer mating pair stabilization protein TraN
MLSSAFTREADFTLFSGTRETCTKKVFGLSNCCSGKGVPLLTPFLCPAAERELDKKDDKGLCHRVGTYCSDKVLGVCVTRKDAYCCFESKLSRILQQQGRQQIGKRWGEPKHETCKGFTLEEFSRLDLSVMNFTEVYADFLDAAKVPDELDTSRQIQQRIEDYLQQNGRP